MRGTPRHMCYQNVVKSPYTTKQRQITIKYVFLTLKFCKKSVKIDFQLIIYIDYYKIKKLKKVFIQVSLQARNNFLKIFKPAGICSGTPFVRNSSWVTPP